MCLIGQVVGVRKGDLLPGSLGASTHPGSCLCNPSATSGPFLTDFLLPFQTSWVGFFFFFLIVLQQPDYQADFAISLFSFQKKIEKRKKYYISINKYKGCVQVIPCAIVENYF